MDYSSLHLMHEGNPRQAGIHTQLHIFQPIGPLTSPFTFCFILSILMYSIYMPAQCGFHYMHLMKWTVVYKYIQYAENNLIFKALRDLLLFQQMNNYHRYDSQTAPQGCTCDKTDVRHTTHYPPALCSSGDDSTYTTVGIHVHSVLAVVEQVSIQHWKPYVRLQLQNVGIYRVQGRRLSLHISPFILQVAGGGFQSTKSICTQNLASMHNSFWSVDKLASSKEITQSRNNLTLFSNVSQ